MLKEEEEIKRLKSYEQGVGDFDDNAAVEDDETDDDDSYTRKYPSKNSHRSNRNERAFRRPWTDEEDYKCTSLASTYANSDDIDWSLVAREMRTRSAKQCRERWRLKLDPEINRAPWSKEEDTLLRKLHEQFGNGWVAISRGLDRRSEHACKSRWRGLLRAERRSGSNKEMTRSLSSTITTTNTKHSHVPASSNKRTFDTLNKEKSNSSINNVAQEPNNSPKKRTVESNNGVHVRPPPLLYRSLPVTNISQQQQQQPLLVSSLQHQNTSSSQFSYLVHEVMDTYVTAQSFQVPYLAPSIVLPQHYQQQYRPHPSFGSQTQQAAPFARHTTIYARNMNALRNLARQKLAEKQQTNSAPSSFEGLLPVNKIPGKPFIPR